MTRGAVPVVALAAVLAVAGCGEKRHNSSSSGASPPAATASISETEFKLTPSTPSVAPGGTITVKNDGSTTHALEIELPKGETRSKHLAPGQSATLKVPDKAGSYDMYCPIDGHKQQGMTGKLTVGGNSSSSGGGTTTGSSGGGGGSPGGY